MSNQVFLWAADVYHFIKNYAFSRGGVKNYPDVFNQMLSDLEAMESHYLVAEKQAYDMFQVSGLKELQQKIDLLNQSSLMSFSANVFNLSSLSKQFKTITATDIQQALIKYINDNPGSVVQDAANDKVLEVTDQLLNQLKNYMDVARQNRSSNQKEVKKHYLKIELQKILNYIPKGSSNLKISSTYRKDLIGFLQEKSNSLMQSTWEMEVPIDNPNSTNDVVGFSYYPYYGLTEEEVKIALNLNSEQGRVTWEQFKSYICNFVGNILSPVKINSMLDWLGPKAFIVYDKSGVQGILGELQMIFMSLVLTNSDVLPSGNLRNALAKNHAQLGTDILLGPNLGIQVKNYSTFHGGYWLKKTLAWETLEEKITSMSLQSIKEYLATVSFNKPYTRGQTAISNDPHLQEYINFYDNMISAKKGSLNSSLNSFFATQAAFLFGWSDLYQLMNADGQLLMETQETYDQAFYIFGGKTIVPISKIVHLLKIRVEKLITELSNGLKATRGNFFVGQIYSGPTWSWDAQAQGSKYPLTIDDVMKHLNLKFSLNVYLDDLGLDSIDSIPMTSTR